MRHRNSLAALFLLTFAVTGCAHSMDAKTAATHKPEYRLIVQMSRRVLTDEDLLQSKIILVARSWADQSEFSEVIPVHCILREEVFECMVTVHEEHVKLDLQKMPSFPPKPLCGKIHVGVTMDRFGFEGDRPTAAIWLDLEPKDPAWCNYLIPDGFFAKTREAIKRAPSSNDLLTN